jgi:hypothetical protein
VLDHVFDSSVYIPLLLAAFVAGLARGFSGFGGALIFVPLASALASPQIAAPVLLIIDGVLAAPLIPAAWRRADLKEVGVMALGAAAGVPAGVAALAHLPALTLRWIIAALVFATVLLLLSGWRYQGRPAKPVTVTVGALSGLFGGIAQIGGPPVVTYWLGSKASAGTIRANIIVYFAATTLLSLAFYAGSRLLTTEVWTLALIAGPGYGAGLLIGSRIFGLASPEIFRRTCLALITLALVLSLPVYG